METVAEQSIEQRRLHEQTRLDAIKTAPQRNKWGQFATPPELALNMARYANTLIGAAPVRFLDPAIGTGSFFSALTLTFPPNSIAAASGIELDPQFAEAAATLWAAKGLRVVQGDFTKQPLPDPRFNLVIANPPTSAIIIFRPPRKTA